MKRPNPDLNGKKLVQLQRKGRANPDPMQRNVIDEHLPARFARVIGRSQRTDGDHRLAMTAASIAAVRDELLFAGCRFLQHGHDLNMQYRLVAGQIERAAYPLFFREDGGYIPRSIFIGAKWWRNASAKATRCWWGWRFTC